MRFWIKLERTSIDQHPKQIASTKETLEKTPGYHMLEIVPNVGIR